jgi:hypothetical protein
VIGIERKDLVMRKGSDEEELVESVREGYGGYGKRNGNQTASSMGMLQVRSFSEVLTPHLQPDTGVQVTSKFDEEERKVCLGYSTGHCP